MTDPDEYICMALQHNLPNIMDRHFTNRTIIIYSDTVTIATSLLYTCLLGIILNRYPAMLIDIAKQPKLDEDETVTKGDMIVIYSEINLHEEFALGLRWNAYFQFQSRIIVITKSYSEILMWLKALWGHTMNTDTAVMFAQVSYAAYYSWLPFQSTECATVESMVEISPDNIFKPKLGINMNSCPLTVIKSIVEPYVLSDTEGIEPKILHTIANHFNLSVIFKELPSGTSVWDWSADNDTVPGALKMLSERNIDLCIGGLLRTIDAYKALGLVTSHTEEEIVWFVPAPKISNRHFGAFKTFNLITWKIIAAVTVGIYIVFYLNYLTKPQLRDTRSTILTTISIGLSQPVFGHFNFNMRLFITCACLYSMHMSTAYQSSLIMFLSEIPRDKPPTTIEQVANSKMKIALLDAHLKMANETDHAVWNKLLAPKRVIIEQSLTDYLRPNVDVAFLAPINSVSYALQLFSLYDEHGYPYILSLPEPFYRSSIAFYMAPGHALLNGFNRATQNLIEGGFVDFWSRTYMPRYNAPRWHSEKQAFALEILAGPFWLLLSMLLLASIVFLLELFVYHCVNGKNKRPS